MSSSVKIDHDHTRAEVLQWALNHAEAAEAADQAYRHGRGVPGLERQNAATLEDVNREAMLSLMWSRIAQAMPS